MSSPNLVPLIVREALRRKLLKDGQEVWFARLARFPREYRRGRISMIDYETGDVHVKFSWPTVNGMKLRERILTITDTVVISQ